MGFKIYLKSRGISIGNEPLRPHQSHRNRRLELWHVNTASIRPPEDLGEVDTTIHLQDHAAWNSKDVIERSGRGASKVEKIHPFGTFRHRLSQIGKHICKHICKSVHSTSTVRSLVMVNSPDHCRSGTAFLTGE